MSAQEINFNIIINDWLTVPAIIRWDGPDPQPWQRAAIVQNLGTILGMKCIAYSLINGMRQSQTVQMQEALTETCNYLSDHLNLSDGTIISLQYFNIIEEMSIEKKPIMRLAR